MESDLGARGLACAYLGHTLDPDIGESFSQTLPALVVAPLVLPWGYVLKHYALAPADLKINERLEMLHKGVDRSLVHARRLVGSSKR